MQSNVKIILTNTETKYEYEKIRMAICRKKANIGKEYKGFDFNGTRIIIGISINKIYKNEDEFISIINLILNKFKESEVLIEYCDALQRFTNMLEFDIKEEKAAKSVANQDGKDFSKK